MSRLANMSFRLQLYFLFVKVLLHFSHQVLFPTAHIPKSLLNIPDGNLAIIVCGAAQYVAILS